MKKKMIIKSLVLSGIVALIIGLFFPIFNNIKYGLDLQGGFEVLYEAETLDGSKITKDMITSTYKTLQKRIDLLGVSEPNIIIEGDNRIRLQLAGITNEHEAKQILSQPATLSFRDTNDNLLMTSDVLRSGGAKVATDKYGHPAVSLAIKDKDTFYRVTKDIKERTENLIVIWLDFNPEVNNYTLEQKACGEDPNSNCLSAAYVNQAFADDVIIQGNFTSEKAQALAELINSGSIPTKLNELSTRNVSSVFGTEALTKTLTAGLIGIAGIIIFMILNYYFVGLLAGIGIIFYIFLVFLIFWLIGGVLTLPGIASLVLGIGMAVDACIISFERIKEELKKGCTLLKAQKEGYQRSFTAIIDANITTLIVAIIMFVFGESSVKGFATMLIINIIITIIVMVFLIRYLIKAFVATKYFNQKLHLFINYKAEKPTRKNCNFFKTFRICYLASFLILIIGLGLYFVNGFNLSIDYKGGTYFTVNSKENLNIKKVKQDFITFNYEIDDFYYLNNKQTTYFKLTNVLNNEQIQEMEQYFQEQYHAECETGVISNIVKQELTKNALYSILLALLGIVIYVTIRFKFTFALVAIVPLLHDALLILAIFTIFKLEIAVIFIAAILTIIGYSINDTVVIFDRVRENLKGSKKDKITIINNSIGETLSRTIKTSISTMLPIIALIMLGSFSMLNFNLAILFGLFIGTYSSIFLASQFWYYLETSKFGENLNKSEEDELEEKVIAGINN